MIEFLIHIVFKMKRRILIISGNSLFFVFVLLTFLGVGYPQPEKVQLAYDRYHSYNEMVEILQKLEKTYLQLGWVEVGGWREKLVRQNPPPGPLLKEICDQHYRWTIYIARLLPRLEIVRLESNKLSGKLFKITGVVRNVGYLPTNVTHQALIAHAVEPVLAKLKLPKGAKILMGKEETNLGQIAGNFVDRIVEWLILSPSSGEVCLDVISTRAGTPVRKIRLR